MQVYGHEIYFPTSLPTLPQSGIVSKDTFHQIGEGIKDITIWAAPHIQALGKWVAAAIEFLAREGTILAIKTWNYGYEHPDYSTIVLTLLAFSFFMYSYGYMQGERDEHKRNCQK